jgi:hypothetical protein
MTAEDWPTATGGRWHPTTVRRIALAATTTDDTTTGADDAQDDATLHLRIAGTA